MLLDLRLPIVVVAGAFNPAIFSPGWVAREIYGVAEGEEVSGVFVGDDQGLVRPYIENTAVQVEPTRLSIFADLCTNELFDRCEQLLTAVAVALPHTPVAALGFNYTIVDQQPDGNTVDALAAGDRPEKIAKVLTSTITSALFESPECVLNFQRGIQGESFVANFNFHYQLGSMSDIDGRFKNTISEKLGRCKSLLEELYNVDCSNLSVKSVLNH